MATAALSTEKCIASLAKSTGGSCARQYAAAPAHAARFCEQNLGMTSSYRQSYAESDGASCAQRELMTSLANFQTHFFTSEVTLEGAVTVAQWVSFWSDRHGNFSEAGFAWDAWMHHSMTYYVPELTPFLAKWAENGTPFLARKYVNALDGKPLQHRGEFFEVVAPPLKLLYAQVNLLLFPLLSSFSTRR